MTSNASSERPPGTARMERKTHSRVCAKARTEPGSGGSTPLDCSGYVPYKLNATTVPTKEATAAPTLDNPNVAATRFEADTCGKLKNRIQAETANPVTSGKPKTTKSESVQNACETVRLR